MSEMPAETPQDPFVPVEASDMMTGLHMLYSAAITAGFPEQRAFDLIDHFFLTYMAAAQAVAVSQAEQEG